MTSDSDCLSSTSLPSVNIQPVILRLNPTAVSCSHFSRDNGMWDGNLDGKEQTEHRQCHLEMGQTGGEAVPLTDAKAPNYEQGVNCLLQPFLPLLPASSFGTISQHQRHHQSKKALTIQRSRSFIQFTRLLQSPNLLSIRSQFHANPESQTPKTPISPSFPQFPNSPGLLQLAHSVVPSCRLTFRQLPTHPRMRHFRYRLLGLYKRDVPPGPT
ncbi:hypothetical protein B0H65DRAFT_292629 [Neurospora tetraspora]|uniref:Uncharacterized protein n=1 Tax=Neurospora tetraspora TaxID=94610 RepID=A0AAE0MNH4_9PEZI|nr:hypothetical protein B0H65DRAFT_292629 [Neurospora tetraspora]